MPEHKESKTTTTQQTTVQKAEGGKDIKSASAPELPAEAGWSNSSGEEASTDKTVGGDPATADQVAADKAAGLEKPESAANPDPKNERKHN